MYKFRKIFVFISTFCYHFCITDVTIHITMWYFLNVGLYQNVIVSLNYPTARKQRKLGHYTKIQRMVI